MLMKEETFNKLFKPAESDAYRSLDVAMAEFSIEGYDVEPDFLAQCAHESTCFKKTVENMNYTAKRLTIVFPKYFPSLEEAFPFDRQPEMLANYVYASRMGNGSVESGDGWNYRARGYIGITGRDLYKALSNHFSRNFINNPYLLQTPVWAARSAAWFWKMKKLNSPAVYDDIYIITRRINGGLTGLENRKMYFQLISNAIKNQ